MVEVSALVAARLPSSLRRSSLGEPASVVYAYSTLPDSSGRSNPSIDVTAETVATLVREQFPQWGSLEVRALRSAGTVKAIFRLGDSFAARFPLRLTDPAAARSDLERESSAGAELARIPPSRSPSPWRWASPAPDTPYRGSCRRG
ncbi:hypothetical protein ACQPZX_44140 [Actinoplanes sp. CA-142083]|uniref:hypothetical protein n=1 Tax=Actinoplanes sp. CA-142083 TaxID=3239903 RepID=UPI003D8A9FBA